MNELIKEYLALVERTVKTNDIFAYQKIETDRIRVPRDCRRCLSIGGSIVL
jgi:hypothetical protein